MLQCHGHWYQFHLQCLFQFPVFFKSSEFRKEFDSLPFLVQCIGLNLKKMRYFTTYLKRVRVPLPLCNWVVTNLSWTYLFSLQYPFHQTIAVQPEIPNISQAWVTHVPWSFHLPLFQHNGFLSLSTQQNRMNQGQSQTLVACSVTIFFARAVTVTSFFFSNVVCREQTSLRFDAVIKPTLCVYQSSHCHWSLVLLQRALFLHYWMLHLLKTFRAMFSCFLDASFYLLS